MSNGDSLAVAGRPAGELVRRRVLVVDNHAPLRAGLGRFLNGEPDLTVCGEADDARQALQMVETSKPDVVITGLFLNGNNSIGLIKEIKARHPILPVVVFSMHSRLVYGEAVVRAGAHSFIQKHAPPEELLAGIRSALAEPSARGV